jgi:transitional endoplasmic reticulum ATPase
MLNAPAYALQEIRLTVVSTVPKGIVHIDANTEVELRSEYTEAKETRRADVTYDDLGGLGSTIDQLREMVELPLRYPRFSSGSASIRPRACCCTGPPGTGKTRLARAVANESDANFFHIAGPEIMGSAYGESEKKLRELFEEAGKAAPSIIFIDEIDSIAPKRGQVHGETEKRLVAQLLTLLDGLEPRQNLVVIAATNRPEAIDEALRRPGRFDREIVVGVPDERGRREVLGIHTRGMPLDGGVNLNELSRRTYGFVGADLAALVREAAIEAVRRIMPKINLEEGTIPPEVLETLSVLAPDFDEALKRVQPSAMREVMVQAPDVGWTDVGGLGPAQERLREGVELPLQNPEAFKRLGIRRPKGFLLYGPPGTGKTLLAKATAREGRGELHRHQIVRPAVQMVWRERAADCAAVCQGPPGRADRDLHRRARQSGAPPAAAAWRAAGDRAGGQYHSRRDGRAGGARLGGRDRRHQSPQPDRPGPAPPGPFRRADLRLGAGPRGPPARARHPHRQDAARPDVDLDDMAARSERFTGADLEDLVRRAGLFALRDSLGATQVTADHFQRALKETRASVTPEMEKEYERIQENLKQDAMSSNAGHRLHRAGHAHASRAERRRLRLTQSARPAINAPSSGRAAARPGRKGPPR